jgi:hypothetical protein
MVRMPSGVARLVLAAVDDVLDQRIRVACCTMSMMPTAMPSKRPA